MPDFSIERGAFPISSGYETSRSLNGPSAPPQWEAHPPDVAGTLGPTGPLPGTALPPVSAPTSRMESQMPAGVDDPEMLRQAALAFSTNYVALNIGAAEFAGHVVVLTEQESEAIRLILARSVARSLDEEKLRVLNTVQLPEWSGQPMPEARRATDNPVPAVSRAVSGESAEAPGACEGHTDVPGLLPGGSTA